MNESIEESLLTLEMRGWRLLTDSVMGGVSQGAAELTDVGGEPCLRMTGDVSTRNNGGFIQVVHDFNDSQRTLLAVCQGVQLIVRGNGEPYNVHLRTQGLWFPWQAYRAQFQATPEWQLVRIPFSVFAPYKTGSQLARGKISRIGIVAIGRDFAADICVAGIGFYR